MNKVTIDRELLERVIGEGSGASLNAMRELRAILAAPRQPEGEGLTRYGLGIVGGITAFVSADDGCMVLYEDAQRAIAELRGECERLRLNMAEYNEAIACYQSECDTLRQKRDKLAGLLRDVRPIVALEVVRWARAAAILPVNTTVESGLLARIDAALAEVNK